MSQLIVMLMVMITGSQSVRFRSLSCPNYCPKVIDPVCGSDGKIYKNDCERRKINCGDDVELADWKVCRANSGLTKCEHECDKDPDMVCGTDGRTYINHCYLMVEHCQKGVSLSHYGSCTNTTISTTSTSCPQSCVGSARDGPVCGSDGNVYKNTCVMQRDTCGQGVVASDRRHCSTTRHCEDKCFRISKISCGSDGKLYNNGCQMKRKNCGKQVYEVPASFCLNRLYHTKCPVSCKGAKQKPVCGSDGQLYASNCELKKMTCGFPLTRYERITEVPLKKCLDKIKSCSRMSCSRETKYVCGNDGVTYRNLCELQEATCRAGVQLSHQGSCVDLSKSGLDCPKDCEKKSGPDEVVCGSDGNVYPNICTMKQKTCGQRIVESSLDNCQTTRYCNKECPKEDNNFVCGSDKSLYRNKCEMMKAHCGKHVYQIPMSSCVSTFQWSGCARVCPPSLEPVCGSDDKTYLNSCFMSQENCRARSLGGVTMKHYGKCGQPEQRMQRNYMYR